MKTGASPCANCGHAETYHYDDRDGMVTDGACQTGQHTGVKCGCEYFRDATIPATDMQCEHGNPPANCYRCYQLDVLAESRR